ncbi:MAG: hypothetical protein HQK77_19315 [Desulfobacterales bacterium]|nr:hypothetical protein [Desulfobacterales bacterium]
MSKKITQHRKISPLLEQHTDNIRNQFVEDKHSRSPFITHWNRLLSIVSQHHIPIQNLSKEDYCFLSDLLSIWDLDPNSSSDNIPYRPPFAQPRLALAEFGNYLRLPFRSLTDFETYLVQRAFRPESQYGLFESDATVLRFTDDPYGKQILDNIKLKNEKSGMGNIHIPNTKIRLINYSYCPQCKKVFSFKDLLLYYHNPRQVEGYDIEFILRNDSRVFCKDCNAYFLPSMIIEYNGEAKLEMELICRTQLIHFLEQFYWLKYHRTVLTQKKENILPDNKIRNDIFIGDLVNKPTLILNMLKYSQYQLGLNFILGKNIEHKDILFG